MQLQTREAFARLLAQGWRTPLADSTRQTHLYVLGDDERIQPGRGFRLDFLLVNGILRSYVVAAGVNGEYRGREKPGDHAPVWISIHHRAG